MKLTVLFFLITFSFTIAQVPVHSNQFKDNLIDSSQNILSKYDYTNLLTIIISASNQGDPWIQRKEIASWGATVLFMTILGFISTKIRKHRKRNVYLFGIFIYSFLLLWLFTHFINEQFGSVSNDIANRSIYIYELIKKNEATNILPFPFQEILKEPNIDQIKSDSLYKKLKNHIRSRNIFQRILLPIKHVVYRMISYFIEFYDKEKLEIIYWEKNSRDIWLIFDGKKQPTTLEMEEAIQYNIMIITFLAFTLYIIPKRFWDNIKKVIQEI